MDKNRFLWAAHCDFSKMKAMLAENAEYLQAVGPDGESPMGAAAHSGQEETVKYLLEQGVELDLFAACMLGWREEVRSFLRGDPSLVHARAAHAHGYSVLHFAAVTDQVAVAEILFAYGADTSVGPKGYTPLHCAANNGKLQMTRWLMAKGANVNASMEPYGVTPLHMAAMQGQTEIVAELLAHGADVNARSRAGETPLGNALLKGHGDVAALLRQHGAE